MADVEKFKTVVSSLSTLYQPFLDALYSMIDRVGTKAALTAGYDFVVGYAAWYVIQKIDFTNPNPYSIGFVAACLFSMMLVTIKYFAARQIQENQKIGGTTPPTPPTI